MQSRYRVPYLLIFATLAMIIFTPPTLAAPPSEMRVGLSFGKDAWSRATFSSEQGLMLGGDLNQAPLITMQATDRATLVGDGFRIEVGSYSSPAEAERVTAALRGAKLDATIFHLAGTLWSVRVGQSLSAEGLAPVKAALQQNGFGPGKDIGAVRLQIEEPYATRSDAEKRVASLRASGLTAYLAYDGSWRVWVGDNQVNDLEPQRTAVSAVIPNVNCSIVSPDINRVIILNAQYDPILVYSAQTPPSFTTGITSQRADNYRVEVGPYGSLNAANQAKQQITELGYAAYLYRHEEGTVPSYSLLVGDAWDNATAQGYGTLLKAKGYGIRYIDPNHLISFTASASPEKAMARVKDLRSKQIEASLYYDTGWRVAVGNAANAQEMESLKSRLSALYPLEPYIPTAIDGGRMQVFDDGGRLLGFYQVPPERLSSLKLWASTEGSILLSEKEGHYPGSFEIRRYYHGGITVINQVTVDDYTAGVVAEEMYVSWPIEALKAQAVIARSYGVRKIGNPVLNQWGCDVDDTTKTQVYTSLEKGGLPNVHRAAYETSGQFVWYKGEIAETVFHSDAGGFTENSENVWQSQLAYLRGVPELFPDESPYSSWEEAFAPEEVGRLIKLAGYGNVGRVTDMVIEKAGIFGRPTKLRIVGSAGEVTLTKEQPRSVFKLLSTNFIIDKLGSLTTVTAKGVDGSIFPVAPGQAMIVGSAGKQILTSETGAVIKGSDQTIAVSAGTNNQFTFRGKGYGHGVGLSQWGAKAMADRGYTYIQILQHYYKDIVIK